MASTINSTTTAPGGLVTTGDASNQLELQTGDTTRLTIDSSGNATFTGDVSVNGTLSGTLSATGSFVVNGTSASGADIKLYEDTDNGTNYVAFQAPASIASNITWTLPSVDGTSGQVLSTNGSGTLSWTTASGSSQWTTTGSDIYYNTGNVGIGTNTPAVKLHVAGTGNANSIMTNQVFRIVGGGNAINFGDDGTDSLIGVGNSSSNISILSRVAGVYSKTLTVNSDSTIKTAATISVGNATPSTSGVGITFPATQSASTDANTLDDYEEGSWTPVFTPASGSFTSVTYAPSIGYYVKIGKWVWVTAQWNIDGISVGSASGVVRITGIPFNPSGGRWYTAGIGYSRDWVNAPLGVATYPGYTYLVLTKSGGATGIDTGLTVSDFNTGAPNKNEVGFTICYQTAS